MVKRTTEQVLREAVEAAEARFDAASARAKTLDQAAQDARRLATAGGVEVREAADYLARVREAYKIFTGEMAPGMTSPLREEETEA